MGAPFLVLDDAPTNAPSPLPRAKRLRSGDAQHRGRRVTYVTVESSPLDQLKLLELLADIIREPMQ